MKVLSSIILVMFGVLIFSEARNVTKTIISVNLILLIPTLFFVFVKDRLSQFFMPVVFVRAVMIQTLMQLVIYLYWGHYNPVVIDRLPLLLHQIAFGYLFQFNLFMLLKKKCSFSFSTAAAILSANLFIWFSYKIYFVHYLLIACAIFLKTIITRKINGEERHIFNPSGLVSFLAVLVIIILPMSADFTNYYFGPQIGAFWLWVPHFDLVVLLCSCFTLWTPNLYLIPLSSVSFFIFGDMFTRLFLDMDLIEESGRGAVFLGLTFLITDPSTSPKTRFGQILYGLCYSLSVCLAFSLLLMSGEMLYFKKVLFIVVVNLLNPYFDYAGVYLEKIFVRTSRILENLSRAKWLTIYMLFFLFFFNYFERGTMPPYFFDFTGKLSMQNLPPEVQDNIKHSLLFHPRSDILKDIRPGFGFGSPIFAPSYPVGGMENKFSIIDARERLRTFYNGIVGEFNRKEKCKRLEEHKLLPGEFVFPGECFGLPTPFKKNPDFERY